jgi:RNA polymerase sigma-70 factor (ECF subfamily)
MKSGGIDKVVIERINKGDGDAFAELYDRYFSYLCACATVYVLDFETAKEVVNDVFVKVWNRRGALEFPIHYYLVKSVHNHSLNHIRAAKSKRATLEKYKAEMLDFMEEFTVSENSALALMEAHEMEQMIRNAVDCLPARCRQVFEFYFYDGLSPAEIALRMNINVNTVRVQIKTAIDRIKSVFGSAAPLFIFLFMQGLR